MALETKRARELAVKERRERKRAEKAEAVTHRAAGGDTHANGGHGTDPARLEAPTTTAATAAREDR